VNRKKLALRERVRRGASAAVLGLAVAAVVAVESCKATRQPDGSIDLEIAPDMVIHALGLEDALHQLTDLYRACLQGQFPRPCTPEEEAEIARLIEKTMSLKGDH
jgi:hypothetical protein